MNAINSYGEYAPGIMFYSPGCSPTQEAWKWTTNDRMDAAEAVNLIDGYILNKTRDIAKYKDSVKGYAKYVDQVRKIEASIHELAKTDVTIRGWAREHDLEKYPLFSHIWIC